MLVVKKMKTKAVGAFRVPSKEVRHVDVIVNQQWWLCKKLWENARQSDTVLAERRQRIERSSGECSEGSRRYDTKLATE